MVTVGVSFVDVVSISTGVGSLVLVFVMVFVVLMLIKVGSGFDGLVSSIVVSLVEIVVSSPVENEAVVGVLVDEWSMKDDVESDSLVEVLVKVGEE